MSALYAHLGSRSSHGGCYTASSSAGVLAEGIPPLCAGDLHICPLCLPGGAPHPALPLPLGPVSDVLVGGRPWIIQGHTHPCAGPAQVTGGCGSIQKGSISIPNIQEEEPKPDGAYQHSR